MEKLNIPKTLRVGYQNRDDTYTGKLAYVTYIDDKGKHRKQTSWDNWRNKDIDDDTFDNEPLEGFVLNKNVGGYKSRWNYRQSMCRVYDPRGFEFEITFENLLYILDHCSSIAGKGLEGEFIHAWYGKDLILLPTNTDDYKKSVEFTKMQTLKVTKKDMVEGRIYKDKNSNDLVYLGRHAPPYYDKKSYCNYGNVDNTSKIHVFWDITNEDFQFEKGFTNLRMILNDGEIHKDFMLFHENFIQSRFMHGPTQIKFKKIDPNKYFWGQTFIKDNDGTFYVYHIW